MFMSVKAGQDVGYGQNPAETIDKDLLGILEQGFDRNVSAFNESDAKKYEQILFDEKGDSILKEAKSIYNTFYQLSSAPAYKEFAAYTPFIMIMDDYDEKTLLRALKNIAQAYTEKGMAYVINSIQIQRNHSFLAIDEELRGGMYFNLFGKMIFEDFLKTQSFIYNSDHDQDVFERSELPIIFKQLSLLSTDENVYQRSHAEVFLLIVFLKRFIAENEKAFKQYVAQYGFAVFIQLLILFGSEAFRKTKEKSSSLQGRYGAFLTDMQIKFLRQDKLAPHLIGDVLGENKHCKERLLRFLAYTMYTGFFDSRIIIINILIQFGREKDTRCIESLVEAYRQEDRLKLVQGLANLISIGTVQNKDPWRMSPPKALLDGFAQGVYVAPK